MNNPLRLKILKRTLEVLGPNGEHWAQGAYFEREDGSYISSTDRSKDLPEEPVRFCLAGAVCQAAKDVGYITIREGMIADNVSGAVSLTRLIRDKGLEFQNVAEFNDEYGRIFEDVKALVEERIAQIEEKV